MKIYFVCEYRAREWWYCYGVLDNGFCFGQHICSEPAFAPGDLWKNRPQRQSAVMELFGHQWGAAETELIEVRSKKDIPVWWESHKKLQDGLKPQYARYKELLEECLPSAAENGEQCQEPPQTVDFQRLNPEPTTTESSFPVDPDPLPLP